MKRPQLQELYPAHSVCRPRKTAHGVCRIRFVAQRGQSHFRRTKMGTVPAFGFTLIEVLVATVLSLLLLSGVVLMFSRVAESVTASRAMLESVDRLRLTAARLQQDLSGVTADMSKVWHRPEDNEGYFEYIEGPVTQATAATVAVSSDIPNTPGDTTVGDFDDILMFTTRSTGEPFRGKLGTGNTITSDVAEVAWFLRGRTLHRRVLLVAPGASVAGTTYANCDVSVSSYSGTLTANTLGDLTRRENRFAHWNRAAGTLADFPFDVRRWGQLELPTLRECSYSKPSYVWAVGQTPYAPPSKTQMDFWSNGTTAPTSLWAENYLTTHYDGTYDPVTDPALYEPRIADDVILTNVVGFDVKAWDPTANGGAGSYVDLGYLGTSYNQATNGNTFGHYGAQNSLLIGSATTACVYDTWPITYEYTGAPGLAVRRDKRSMVLTTTPSANPAMASSTMQRS